MTGIHILSKAQASFTSAQDAVINDCNETFKRRRQRICQINNPTSKNMIRCEGLQSLALPKLALAERGR